MKNFHRFFLVIFLCLLFLFPSRVEAQTETLQGLLEQNTGRGSTVKCSDIFSICAEKPKSPPSYAPELLPMPIPTLDPESKINTVPPDVYIPPYSLDAEVLFDLINKHRKKIGLPAFHKEDRLCKIAQSRGPELYDEIFVTGRMHEGFFARNLPYWMTENMINQPTEQAALNWWLNSFVHRNAIEGDYKYSCGFCYGKSCAQIFTNFVPKQLLSVGEDHQDAAGDDN